MPETKVAIVTGAAHGIGRATATRLARQGVALSLVDHDGEALLAHAGELAGSGASVEPYVVDVMDPEAAARVVQETHALHGRIDALANIAGGGAARSVQQIDEIEPELWDFVIALNLRTPYLWCRCAVPVMRQQGYGRIVNMSSTLARGRTGFVGTAGARLPYAAAKAGILGFTAQLAKDVGPFGITVNAVMPWLTLGEQGSLLRTRYEGLSEEQQLRLCQLAPSGRPGESDEVAATICFLMSPEASYVSGVGLPIDGAFL